MPKVSKKQNRTFLNFWCKKFKFRNFKILDTGFYFRLCLESEQYLIKGAHTLFL